MITLMSAVLVVIALVLPQWAPVQRLRAKRRRREAVPDVPEAAAAAGATTGSKEA